jgi:hypothetical protein
MGGRGRGDAGGCDSCCHIGDGGGDIGDGGGDIGEGDVCAEAGADVKATEIIPVRRVLVAIEKSRFICGRSSSALASQ